MWRCLEVRRKNSVLNLTVRNSSLTAESGSHAALVEESGKNNTLTLAMTDTNMTATRNGTDARTADARGNRLVAGPVALADGSGSSLFLRNSYGNRINVHLQPGPGNSSVPPLAVASLGWGYVNESRADNDLCQRNISNNTVQAEVQALGGAGRASPCQPGRQLQPRILL